MTQPRLNGSYWCGPAQFQRRESSKNRRCKDMDDGRTPAAPHDGCVHDTLENDDLGRILPVECPCHDSCGDDSAGDIPCSAHYPSRTLPTITCATNSTTKLLHCALHEKSTPVSFCPSPSSRNSFPSKIPSSATGTTPTSSSNTTGPCASWTTAATASPGRAPALKREHYQEKDVVPFKYIIGQNAQERRTRT